ncbi:MAG: winged helix-turn-helix transcriptional regulator [Alphaproteobacteria bacterium]|nr:winged helix-turn-helix transcriptional regulator [Alphaproteobacteria bacterium]
MKSRRFDLERFLPYLVNRVAVSLVGAFGPMLAASDVTLQEWRVLAALRQGGAMRVSDIASVTSIDISTLSRTLNAMERKGLVVRHRPKGGDARVVIVEATEHGGAVTETLVPEAQKLQTTALAGFSAEEESALKAMLVRVFANVAAQGKRNGGDAAPARAPRSPPTLASDRG